VRGLLARERRGQRSDAGSSPTCRWCLSDQRNIVPVVHVLSLRRRWHRGRSRVSRRSSHGRRSTVSMLSGRLVATRGSIASLSRWCVATLRLVGVGALRLIGVCRGHVLLGW
jgi:hypothetical protein